MDTSFNWLQLRGLGALAAIGIFLVYATLVGWRQERTRNLDAPKRKVIFLPDQSGAQS